MCNARCQTVLLKNSLMGKKKPQGLKPNGWLTKVFQITKEINWTFESDLVEGQVTSKRKGNPRYFTGTSISIDNLLRMLGKG